MHVRGWDVVGRWCVVLAGALLSACGGDPQGAEGSSGETSIAAGTSGQTGNSDPGGGSGRTGSHVAGAGGARSGGPPPDTSDAGSGEIIETGGAPLGGTGGSPPSEATGGASGSDVAGGTSGGDAAGGTSGGDVAGGTNGGGAAGGTSGGGAAGPGIGGSGAAQGGAAHAGAAGNTNGGGEAAGAPATGSGGAPQAGAGGGTPSCVEGAIETMACGLNGAGVRQRACSAGSFGEWSACADPDICKNGTQQTSPCGLNGNGIGTQQCESGNWGGLSCGEVDDCKNGSTQTQACGVNGKGNQGRACMAGSWSAWATCIDPDLCSNGATEQKVCGLNGNGAQQRTCQGGQWSSFSQCSDPDQCKNGATEQQACGLNLRGKRGRECTDGRWSSFGACVDSDVCVDNTQQSVSCNASSDAHSQSTCTLGKWQVLHACNCDDSWKVLACGGSCVAPPEPFTGHVYVDADNAACADGLSWQTAWPTLTAALASPYASYRTLWLAEGTYYTGGPGDPSSKTFELGGFRVLGGFAGTESVETGRDPLAHVTTLSGDLNRSGASNAGDSQRVVSVRLSAATLDGLTITSGYAPVSGGGVYIDQVHARIDNCTFRDNQAGNEAAAIVVYGAPGADILRSRFSENRVFEQYNTSDGVISVYGGSNIVEAAQPLTRIESCTFHDNNAGPATAEAEVVGASYSRLLIVNSLFYKNILRCTAAISSGFYAHVSVHNSTIADNLWICSSCEKCVAGASSWYGGDLRLYNVIARDRVAALVQSGNPTPHLSATYTNHPTQLAGTGNTTVAPGFVDTASADYCLVSGSPLTGQGAGALLPKDDLDLDADGDVSEPLPLDARGNPRVVGGFLEPGMCEIQP